ncbi:hypothetical protein BDV39DRAFT_202110 [Aspergillus sergii]|uniref:Uncharacterized protein n=1 Tax=Aspergillus sergii TaxID=1034303 RepID=A0A5N6XAL6_9EURO|nr:hypothetical protein BDV39DRAFT_202110 [Aspergillus sergii]
MSPERPVREPVADLATLKTEFTKIRNTIRGELPHIHAFVDEAQSLVEAQGISNLIGPHGRTLMHFAAMSECSCILVSLLRGGASTETCDVYRRTPLSWAAEYGAVGSVEVLLRSGARINTRCWQGSTPVSYLVEAGPPTGPIGQPALHRCEHDATKECLLRHGAKGD